MVFVWPFMALVMALLNYRSSWSKNIVWFFSSFFGYNLVIANEEVDANRYREYLKRYHETIDTGLIEFLSQIARGDIEKGDYLQPTLTYLVSRFTDDHRILFATFGLVFGYFYSRNIWMLLEKIDKKIVLNALPFLVLFAFIVPIWDMNGFRFWTATHIFVYGALNVLIDGRKKYLLLSASSLLVHLAFLFPVLILVIHQIIGNRRIVFIGLFFVSFFFLRVDIPMILNVIPQNSNSVVDEKLKYYTHKEYVATREQMASEAIWFMRWRDEGLKYIFLGLFIWLFITQRGRIKKQNLESLFYFSILILAVSNVLTVIPSGGRYIKISYLFITAFLFLFIQNLPAKYWIRRINLLTTVPILFYIVIELRVGLDYVGMNTLFANPMLSAFFENTTSVVGFIKR